MQYSQDTQNAALFLLNQMDKEQLQLFQEMDRQQQEEFMNESLKAITPFEHGGYNMEQGNSWNYDGILEDTQNASGGTHFHDNNHSNFL